MSPRTGLQLRSLIKSSGELELSLATVDVPDPGPGEILVRIEASPINPSDLGLLLGPADISSAKASAGVTTAPVPPQFMKAMAARLDESMPVGNEGAGVVIAAGSDPAAQALLGRTVAILGGAMYAQYRIVKAADALPLPADATPAEGASCFVNPLTALGMVETGATIAFDAIGGGKLASQILSGMEAAANRTAGAYSRYGSTTFKQLYIYGGLNTGPTELVRSYGMQWAIGGWLLTFFLIKIGPEAAQKLRERVANNLKTTFASNYTAEIGLAEALQPETIARYNAKTTGEKYLIVPTKGLN